MASISTSSSSEEHTSETDLSDIPTKEERKIDTTTWSTTKHKKATTHDRVSRRVPKGLWRESIHMYYNEK